MLFGEHRSSGSSDFAFVGLFRLVLVWLLRMELQVNVVCWFTQSADGSRNKPRFIAVTSLEDVQAIRTVAFHPEGNLFVVGANSKTLRICRFPAITELR